MDVNTTLAASAIVQEILWAAGVFFLVYLIGYSTFQFLAVATGASELYRRRREARYRNRTELDCHVPVSILVPAHNEGVTIVSPCAPCSRWTIRCSRWWLWTMVPRTTPPSA